MTLERAELSLYAACERMNLGPDTELHLVLTEYTRLKRIEDPAWQEPWALPRSS